MLQIKTIPCLSDNYAFLAHDPDSGETALVDIPEAAPILAALDDMQWSLTHILITHHHPDHVMGLGDVLATHPAKVYGNAADAARLPKVDHAVNAGETLQICGEDCHVLDVSGHTIGHVAFHFPTSKVVFTADSLMALGCGRVFEGTMAQMHASLQSLAALPPDTIVCSGHEYTEANGRFALTIDPDNPALQRRITEIAAQRAKGEPTVPSTLAEERATNPYLRTEDDAIRQHLGLTGANSEAVFTEIRQRKDRF
jgi:hydroxyacylglutathione hydrolase